ncbi:DUF2514 family protein [Pandoraea pulmonicola]|uniref:Protein of uncharacterized function (DUF2514) n=1 Tax=Pandoraea pulmonicola TaxID=93221 RepID=A0AAJ5D2R2_PANPU|nr:DUF2514 family protein [Pandoraea pulmonicola]AJC22646.1 hypothetical protein RO07_23210 [Pandoraea pulmonicola]SUA93126.1 Protein of uncharacterised function (DUF2514) [Pandoraea pulmonicola]
MSWIDPRLWGAFLLAAVLAAGGGYWKGRHDADQSATVAKQAKQIKDLTDANNLYRQTNTTLAGISIDAKKTADTAIAAARASDASSELMRKQLAAFTASVRRSTAAGGSAPTIGGSDALDLLTGLLGRIDDAAGRLAEFADAAHIAGLACERSYDALMKKGNR